MFFKEDISEFSRARVEASISICNESQSPGLQIYGEPAPLPHDFKIWCTTFQGSGSRCMSILAVKNLTLMKKFIFRLLKTESWFTIIIIYTMSQQQSIYRLVSFVSFESLSSYRYADKVQNI